jgi:hypothetical protein
MAVEMSSLEKRKACWLASNFLTSERNTARLREALWQRSLALFLSRCSILSSKR